MSGIRTLLLIAIGSSAYAGELHTIESNLRYRLTRVDLITLGEIAPAAPESKRAIKIENGDQLMPPFKDVLEPGQIKDVIAYVKTL